MKTFRITVIIFSILTAFTCNNQQDKKADENTSEIRKRTYEKSLIKKPDKTEQNDSKPCENLVTQILTSSSRYRQLTKGLNKAVVKNGGLSFGLSLEGSPNRTKDKTCCYSKTYDFTIYEMYPERQLNTIRFSFDPNNKQLYEYDAVHDKKTSIEFDRSLLIKYEALCK